MSLCSARPYERRKEPLKVRAALIDAAAQVIAEQGLSRLTVNVVARTAGVTKGGLFHHFATKQDLIRGVVDVMLASAAQTIAAAMAADPEPHGAFTRAYLANVFADHRIGAKTSARALCLATLADPEIQDSWTDWVAAQVACHAATDDNPRCALVRFAADGAWMNSLRHTGPPEPLPPEIHERLIALTRPEA